MKILVTAGNTETPVDQVRCITNIFSGRTGSRIALEAYERGHSVCLLTSHPEVADLKKAESFAAARWRVQPYRTFDDLHRAMAGEILSEQYDAVIHVAAVSDYQVVGTYGLAEGAQFDNRTRSWSSDNGGNTLIDASAGKVKSSHQEVWLRMKPTPKLVDKIRAPWGFEGVLVKFKLEVGITESELSVIAENSRLHSQADIIVANTLDGMHDWALLLEEGQSQVRLPRATLADQLLSRVEARNSRVLRQCFAR